MITPVKEFGPFILADFESHKILMPRWTCFGVPMFGQKHSPMGVGFVVEGQGKQDMMQNQQYLVVHSKLGFRLNMLPSMAQNTS